LLIRHLHSKTRVLIAVGLAVAAVAGAFVGGYALGGGSLTRTSTTEAASVADQQDARGVAADKASRGGRADSGAGAAAAEEAREQAAERAAREAERQAAEKRAAEKRAAEKRAAEKRAAAKRAAAKKSEGGGYDVVDTVRGTASFFGDAGEYQPMACGGHTSEITEGVALWEIPCGTPIRITSKETGKSVIAPVTDRGPADWTGVAIDLLPDTWDALGVPRSQGLQEVTYEVLRK
jgi:rare lipoprotein A (peptidoglycan hydrolase)